MIQKRYIRYFIGANIAILLSTVALMCIPICAVNATGREKLFSVCVGIVFWSGVFGTLLLDWRCRVILKKYGKGRKKTKHFEKPDMLRFAENKYTRVIDISMGIAALCLVLILIFNVRNDWLVMADISMLFMTFSLHCLYSGKFHNK